MQTETTRPIGQILETLGSCAVQPTTEPPVSPSSSDKTKSVQPAKNYEEKKRAWLDKWLAMEARHPQLQRLENSVYSFCEAYAKCPARGHRLIIFGENGSGKSHCARAIYHWATSSVAIDLPRVINQDGQVAVPDCAFYSWPGVVDGFKLAVPEWYVVDEMFNPSLLIVDDLGAEHDPSRVGIEKLYRVLEHRAQKWMVITTNLPPTAWEERFERRVASRLFRNAVHVDLSLVPDFSASN